MHNDSLVASLILCFDYHLGKLGPGDIRESKPSLSSIQNLVILIRLSHLSHDKACCSEWAGYSMSLSYKND